MTNNPTIDGVSVPRELIERILNRTRWHGDPLKEELRALLDAPVVEPASDLREHCKQCAEVVKTWPEWKRGCLGGEPVVERQPVAPFYISADDWNLLVRSDVEIASVRVSRTRRSKFTESLFAHPPEVAALQSTIAQLQARVTHLEGEKELMLRGAEVYKERIAELESGRSEPVAWMTRCIKGVREGVVEHADGPDDVENTEYWTPAFPVFTAPPVPVAVVLPELGDTAENHMRWLLEKVVNPGDYPVDVLHDQIRSTLSCLDATTALNEVRSTVHVGDLDPSQRLASARGERE